MVCLFAHPHTQVVALGGHISWPSAAIFLGLVLPGLGKVFALEKWSIVFEQMASPLNSQNSCL